jgi:hypothetical protein
MLQREKKIKDKQQQTRFRKCCTASSNSLSSALAVAVNEKKKCRRWIEAEILFGRSNLDQMR